MAKEIKTRKTQKEWLKVFQIFAAYLVAAWTFLQFVDWIVNRYEISTNWVDLWLWIFIGIIPSLLIYIYHQERLNKGVLRLREKIIFPLNVCALAIGLYFGFGTSDLGATTKEIKFVGEDGTVIRREITKDEFRIGIPLFNFKQTNKDSATLWLERGIRDLLYFDIHQDKNTNPSKFYGESTTEKVEGTKRFYDFYADGTYFFEDNLYTILPNVRNGKNGKLLASKSFRGPELSKLLDSVSIFIREEVGITEKRRERYIDLEIQEFTSDSLKAIEYLVKGDYESAIAIDSSFSLAYLSQAANNIRYSKSKFEEQFTIDRAFKNRLKLPEDRQLQILIYKHIAYNDWQKAEELVKLQLEIEPNNDVYINLLYVIYSETKQLKAYLDYAKMRFEKEFNESTGERYMNALLINGKYNKSIDELDKFLFLNPNDKEAFFLKIRPLILNGDLKEARTILKKAQVMHPEWDIITKVYDSRLSYLEQHPKTTTDLSFFKGEFRNTYNEQIYSYSVDNEVCIASISNQDTWPLFRSGEAELTTPLTAFNLVTANGMFDKEGNVYALQMDQYFPWMEGSQTWFAFKLDEAIKKAELLLSTEDYQNAESACIKAIAHNPEHFYLEQALNHINYIKETDSLELLQQYKGVEGEYGPRKFWVENGKLFYKRLGNNNLPRIQLLPISKTRYINLTRLTDNLIFEYKEGNAIASYSWRFDVKNKDWIKLDDKNNYFMKN